MSDTYELWVPMKPKTKDRPRLGRGRKAFTPAATLQAEQLIRSHYWADGGPLFTTPVAVHADFYPDGLRIQIAEMSWTSPLTGDTDNYLKLVLDALQPAKNGTRAVAYENDRQVVGVSAAKHPKREGT